MQYLVLAFVLEIKVLVLVLVLVLETLVLAANSPQYCCSMYIELVLVG